MQGEWLLSLFLKAVPGNEEISNQFLLFAIRCVPESPRWLVSKGRLSEAEDIIYDIGIGNGETITRAQIKLSSPSDGKTDKQYRVTDCFKTPELRKRVLIGIVTW